MTLVASVFLFDYRGYGLSGGSPRGEKPLLDAEAALLGLLDETVRVAERAVLVGDAHQSLGVELLHSHALVGVGFNPTDLVEHLVQWGSGLPLLVLVGARPELRDLRSPALPAPSAAHHPQI